MAQDGDRPQGTHVPDRRGSKARKRFLPPASSGKPSIRSPRSFLAARPSLLRDARDFPQLPSCDRDRPSRHLVFFGVW
jgi:hypothetical protein